MVCFELGIFSALWHICNDLGMYSIALSVTLCEGLNFTDLHTQYKKPRATAQEQKQPLWLDLSQQIIIHLKRDMSRLWSQSQSGVSALTLSVAKIFTVWKTWWQKLQCTTAAVNKLAAYLMKKIHFLPQLHCHTHTHTHIWHHVNIFFIKTEFSSVFCI